MQELDDHVFVRRGERKALAHIDEHSKNTIMLAWVWLDRNRRFFITSAHGLEEGEVIFRERWRQLDPDPNAPAERVAIHVAQPASIASYNNGAGVIDYSNRVRQDELIMDRRLQTNEWDMRVGFGIAGIIFMDTFFFHQKTVGKEREELKRTADIFRGRIIDVTEKSYTIELTGNKSKLDAFLESIDRTAILETVRTGSSGIGRGERILRV